MRSKKLRRERPLSSTRRTTNKGGGQDRVDVAQQGRRQQTGRRTPRLSARRAAFDAPKCHLFEPDCPSRCCAHEMRATAIGPPHGTNADSQCDLTTRPARPSSCFCRKAPSPQAMPIGHRYRRDKADLPQGMALCRLSRSGDPWANGSDARARLSTHQASRRSTI